MTIIDSPLFPSLLYLLLVAGIWLTALAVVNPGTGALEIFALAALGLVALGTIYVPFNAWALIVLVLGGVLFIASLRLPRPEVWLSLSALALSVGSVFLFQPAGGGAAVHPLIALSVSLLTLGYFWWAIRSAINAQRARPTMDPDRVIGKIAEVRTELNPVGSVYALGELWTARSESRIRVGKRVIVVDREGLMLLVEIQEEAE
ncbi:MAG: NfeD family protein [Chloroflexota bacterium]|nr:NfeD family protein [Chloroflexota bacterium]